MKISKNNFSSFFNEKLSRKLILLEESRKESLKQFYSIMLFTSLIMIVIIIKAFIFHPLFIIISLIIFTSIAFFAFNFCFSDYKRNFKQRILNILFLEIFDEHEFNSKGFLSQEEFISTYLHRKEFNRYTGEDLITGIFKGHDIKLSELKVSRVERKNGYSTNNRHNREKTVTIFNGLMILLKVKTPYKSITTIEPDNIILQRLSFFHDLNENNNIFESVHLESLEFEKAFSVKSTDQIESRKILTPSVQEGLTEMKKVHNLTFAVSIQPNQISVAFPTSKDLFEPPYFSSCLNISDSKEILEIFLFLEELLKEIYNS